MVDFCRPGHNCVNFQSLVFMNDSVEEGVLKRIYSITLEFPGYSTSEVVFVITQYCVQGVEGFYQVMNNDHIPQSVLKCIFTFNQRNNSKRQSSMNFKEKLIQSIVLITDTFLLPSLYNSVTNRGGIIIHSIVVNIHTFCDERLMNNVEY